MKSTMWSVFFFSSWWCESWGGKKEIRDERASHISIRISRHRFHFSAANEEMKLCRNYGNEVEAELRVREGRFCTLHEAHWIFDLIIESSRHSSVSCFIDLQQRIMCRNENIKCDRRKLHNFMDSRAHFMHCEECILREVSWAGSSWFRDK